MRKRGKFERCNVFQVCVDFKDDKILAEECREGKQFGFGGKQAIHPGQIDIIQKAFLPDPEGKEEEKLVCLNFS